VATIEPIAIIEPVIEMQDEQKIVFELSPVVEESTVEVIASSNNIEAVNAIEDIQEELNALFNAPMKEVEKTEQEMKDDYVTLKGITLNRRKGSRLLTDTELEAEVNFELQKRAFDERASRLRSMSFNVNKADIDSDESNIPAFMRQNKVLDPHPSSSDDVYSDIKINNGALNGSNISTLNTFLNGKNPD
jgi:cell division protein FtsZ